MAQGIHTASRFVPSPKNVQLPDAATSSLYPTKNVLINCNVQLRPSVRPVCKVSALHDNFAKNADYHNRTRYMQVGFMQGAKFKIEDHGNHGCRTREWYGAEYAKTPCRYIGFAKRNRREIVKPSRRIKCLDHQELLMMTLAPSLPNTPLSFALGLLSRPFLRLRKPSMPDGLSALGFCTSEEL